MMSTLRSDCDRGPAANNSLDRFSSTYMASYRPFDDLKNSLPARYLPASKPNLTFANSQYGTSHKPINDCSNLGTVTSSTSTGVSSNAAPITSQPTFVRLPNSTSRTESANMRRTCDPAAPIGDDLFRRKLHSSAFSSNRSTSTFNGVPNYTLPFSGATSNKSYTSTYTTTVAADKLSPCYAVYRESNCDKGVQAVSSKSSSQVPVECLSAGSKSDIVEKKPTPNGSAITSVALSNQPLYPFDLGQMFSQVARINGHLYLSSLSALTPDRLRQYGITLLISAMVDPPPVHLRNAVLNSVHVSVEDAEGANLRVHFDRVADRIAAEQRRGGRALVHCMAGVSRSSTLVLAYLIRHMNMSLADAYKHVRTIRPCIQPNPGFWRQLLDYEERLRGTRSVRLLPPIGYFGSCEGVGISSSHAFSAGDRMLARTSYMDLYSRPAGDLLPYRPLTSLYSIDSGKPFIGCRR